MERESQQLKIPHAADSESSTETESGSEDSKLPSELLDSLERRETARSPAVCAGKNGGVSQIEEMEMKGAADDSARKRARRNVLEDQGTGLLGTTGAATTDSSRFEDGRESASIVERQRNQQAGSTLEGCASMAACNNETKTDKCSKISTDKDLSMHVPVEEPVVDKTAAQRRHDSAQTAQSASCGELRAPGLRASGDKKSESTVVKVREVDANSCAGDAANAEAGISEPKANENQSSVQGRWSIWNQHISHELSMPVRRRPTQEGVGPPLSLTAVGQKLLQVFRERQETAQSIARESNEENYTVMREMLPELRVPGHKTLQECQEELARAAATTQESEDGQSQTAATVPQKCQDKPSRLSTMIPEGFIEMHPGPAATIPVDCQDKPSCHHPILPDDCQNALSHPASPVTVDSKEFSNTTAAIPKDHQDETPRPSATIPKDRQIDPQRPAVTAPAAFRTVPPRTTSTIPDYRHGKRSRHSAPPSAQVREKQLVSASKEQASDFNLIRQSRASAFSVCRKIDFEKKPSPLAVTSASTAELPSGNPRPANIAEHPVVRWIDFSENISPKKEASASQQRAVLKRSLSNDSDTTDDLSSFRPPASKRRAEEAGRVGEEQDTSDDSIESPQALLHQGVFRAIEMAPIADTSGMQCSLSRPVPMRVLPTAKTPSTSSSDGTTVSEQSQSTAHSSTSASSSSEGAVTADSDSSSADTDASSASSTSRSTTSGHSEHQPKEEVMSSRSDSDGSKTAAVRCRGTEAQCSVTDTTEPSGQTRVSEKGSSVTKSGGTNTGSTSHARVKPRGPDRPDAVFGPTDLKSPGLKADNFGVSFACSDSNNEDDALSPKYCSSENKDKNKAAATSFATMSGGEPPTKRAGDNKTAARSSAEVASGLQAALEGGHASCSGVGAGVSSTLASSPVDASRNVSGPDSDMSTSVRHGSASSSSGDELALFHLSSDNEGAAEDAESSTEGNDDVITF